MISKQSWRSLKVGYSSRKQTQAVYDDTEKLLYYQTTKTLENQLKRRHENHIQRFNRIDKFIIISSSDEIFKYCLLSLACSTLSSENSGWNFDTLGLGVIYEKEKSFEGDDDDR